MPVLTVALAVLLAAAVAYGATLRWLLGQARQDRDGAQAAMRQLRRRWVQQGPRVHVILLIGPYPLASHRLMLDSAAELRIPLQHVEKAAAQWRQQSEDAQPLTLDVRLEMTADERAPAPRRFGDVRAHRDQSRRQVNDNDT